MALEPRAPAAPRPTAGGFPAWLKLGTGFVTLRVIVRPGASRCGILRIDQRGPVIGVASAPERGKANAELIEAVARMALVARSAVEVVSGASARHKSLRIGCDDPARTAAALSSIFSRA
jgi:hypothetical protein